MTEFVVASQSTDTKNATTIIQGSVKSFEPKSDFLFLKKLRNVVLVDSDFRWEKSD